MAEKLTRQLIAEKAIVHAELPLAAAPRQQVEVDRNFGLPSALYGATVGLFLAYLGVMSIGFGNPELVLPMAIFVLFVLAGFGVPALWSRMKPDHADRSLGWSRFMSEGVETLNGRCRPGDAIVQVLIMPAIIFGWGVATVTIAALAR